MKIGVGGLLAAIAVGAAAGAFVTSMTIAVPVAAGLATEEPAVEDEHEVEHEVEMDVPLHLVPEVVLAAAREAVDGIVLTEASVELESDGLFYELEGSVGDRRVEIELTPDGDVIEIEDEDTEDDDEADSDD